MANRSRWGNGGLVQTEGNRYLAGAGGRCQYSIAYGLGTGANVELVNVAGVALPRPALRDLVFHHRTPRAGSRQSV